MTRDVPHVRPHKDDCDEAQRENRQLDEVSVWQPHEHRRDGTVEYNEDRSHSGAVFNAQVSEGDDFTHGTKI